MQMTVQNGKKVKFSNDIRHVRSALSAYKLVAFMNHTHTFDGSRLVCNNIRPDFFNTYSDGLKGKQPWFSSSMIEDGDRNLFMTFDWLRISNKHSLLDLWTKPARWKEIHPFAQVYFYEAAIRTLDTKRRVINMDLRFGEEVLNKLKDAGNPTAFIHRRIRNNVQRILNELPELYLVMEMCNRDGSMNIHLHGAILISPEASEEDLKNALRLSLGDYDAARQIKFLAPYPKRAAYLSKQCFDTPETMMAAGFKSDSYLSATNAVRKKAKSLWEDEIRVNERRDFIVDPMGYRKDIKILSRLLDLGVYGARADLNHRSRKRPERVTG